jgi:PAP2 superfamily
MAGKLDLDLDLDLDLNLDLGNRPGSGGGPRFNSDDFPRLIPSPFPNTLPVPTKDYSRDGWDPELRAWAYVEEFIGSYAAPNTAVTAITTLINGQTNFPVPNRFGILTGITRPLTPTDMALQVKAVLDASIDRADRSLEILDQASGRGALHYWTGMLRIDPSKDKSTFLLMLVARKIGEYVAMGLKDHFQMRRPAQVYPLIMPLIDGPDTPSFPSSHSLQAHLITGALKLALTPPAATVWPPVGPPPPPCANTAQALDVLADRIAYNREVAGVHYRMDSLCGHFSAVQILNQLSGLTAFKALVAAAAVELQDMH